MANPFGNEMEICTTPIEESFISPDFRPVHGKITVSDAPGLGIDVNEDVVKHYRIDI